MSYWIESDIITLALAIFLSGLLIPQILRVAHRRKLFDESSEESKRKIHHGFVPRLGGIAFFPSTLFSVCLVLAVGFTLGDISSSYDLSEHGVALIYLASAGMLLYITGMADDLVGVPYRTKFVVQILSAVIVVCSDTVIPTLDGLFWIGELPPVISWILSAFLVVFVVNALNLIDGIDGLATSLSIIALVFYAVILFIAGCYLYSMLACGMIGTLCAFFYFNVFGRAEKGRKIFMGDTGSLTAGLILAFLGLAVSGLPEGMTIDGVSPFVLAYSPLVIPAFDVVRVYLHRVRQHRNPFLPDNTHIHHKLLALGYSQRGALGVIVVFAIFFLAVNILLSPFVQVTFILIIDVAVWTLANVLLTRAIKKREDRVGRKLYE